MLKFPKRAKYGDITLKKGMTQRHRAVRLVLRLPQGAGKRKDGVITLLDAAGTAAHVWCFRRGLPVKYSGPSLNAQQTAVAIESIEIAHEGLYPMGGAAALGSARSASAAQRHREPVLMAEVIIDEIVSTVRAIDGISPRPCAPSSRRPAGGARDVDHDKQVAMQTSVRERDARRIERVGMQPRARPLRRTGSSLGGARGTRGCANEHPRSRHR